MDRGTVGQRNKIDGMLSEWGCNSLKAEAEQLADLKNYEIECFSSSSGSEGDSYMLRIN